ncbi:hypothetical protein LguiA_015905 [Lonicera macranthoides]
MLHCLRPLLATRSTNLQPSSPPLQENSTDYMPSSSSQPSPTVNLTREYTFAVQTSSYSEIWSKIHTDNSLHQEVETVPLEANDEQELLAQVLQPNRECVSEVLQNARPSTLTRLVSDYFDQSEHTSRLCLNLHQTVQRARALYAPLHDLLGVLPLDSDSLSQSQCDHAFEVFLQFDCLENPFPSPDSHNFNDMRLCFSQLKQQLDCRLCKSRSKIRRIRHATCSAALCLIGTTVSVVVSAVVVATHALVALVAAPLLSALLPSKIAKKELAHLAQLDAAAKGTYVLHNDLDTIDRLVARLHSEVEGDKLLVRLGLERGRDKHPIQEVAKQLYKDHVNFLRQLMDLEEHLCLCFAAINRARSLLLQEIHLHQTIFPNQL